MSVAWAKIGLDEKFKLLYTLLAGGRSKLLDTLNSARDDPRPKAVPQIVIRIVEY
jgi:hypothetical protein